MRAAGAVAGLGLGLLACAAAFDAEPLYAPGVGLLVLAGLVSAWVGAAARGASVTRRLGARRVGEGEPLDVVLDVRAQRRGPLPPATLRDPLVPGGLPVAAGRIRLLVRFERRGLRVLEPPVLELRDPLGLAHADVHGAAPADEVLVLPALAPVHARADGDAAGGAALATLALASATEVDGLRPYRDGAPASRIHWPAVARGAGLLERRIRPEGVERALLVLDARAPASVEDLDAAVRAAASLARELAVRAGVAVLLPGDRRPLALEGEGAAWGGLHARLALLGAGGVPAAAAAGGPRSGAVVLVAARRLERFPAAWAAIARGPRVLVVPDGPEVASRRALFSVGGCTGRDLTPAGAVERAPGRGSAAGRAGRRRMPGPAAARPVPGPGPPEIG